MKKLISILLALLMLTGIIAGAENETYGHVDFVHEWKRFVAVQNDIYGTVLWALSYAEEYLADPSWENLLKARHAADSAMHHLTAMVLPEASLPVDAYVAFMEQGYDMSVLMVEWKILPEYRDSALLTLESLSENLEYDVYWQADQECLAEWVALKVVEQRTEMECVAVMTDYLLTTADSPAQRNDEETMFAASFPMIFADYLWVNDGAQLEANYAALVKQVERTIDALEQNVGVQSANLIQVAAVCESDDLTILLENAVEHKGGMRMIADAGWPASDREGVNYYFEDEVTGDNLYTQPGTEIADGVIAHSAVFEGVPRSEFDAYVNGLKAAGVVFYKEDESADVYTVTYIDEHCAFAFRWRNERVIYVSDGRVVLAPRWYIMSGK